MRPPQYRFNKLQFMESIMGYSYVVLLTIKDLHFLQEKK